MSSAASAGAVVVTLGERLEVLFEELAELTGQRNAIDGRIVEIVAEIDPDELCGATGARSVPALVAWKTGCSPANAHTITTIAGLHQPTTSVATGASHHRQCLEGKHVGESDNSFALPRTRRGHTDRRRQSAPRSVRLRWPAARRVSPPAPASSSSPRHRYWSNS